MSISFQVSDPSLHESESTFHSGSNVQPGMKNGMNSTGMSCNSILIHVNKYNPIPYVFNRNGLAEFDLDCNSIQLHVNTPLVNPVSVIKANSFIL